MNKPHKYAKEIHAFADGIEIQEQCLGLKISWRDLIDSPIFDCEGWEFRLKPKEPIVLDMLIESMPENGLSDTEYKPPNIRATFDPDTGKLISVEMIK